MSNFFQHIAARLGLPIGSGGAAKTLLRVAARHPKAVLDALAAA
jgi:hypothetical protein